MLKPAKPADTIDKMIPFVERETRLHTCQPINDRPCTFECVACLVEIAGGARFEKPSVHAALIRGYKQLIARAHLHGMRIIGATLTPFEDTFKGTVIEGYYNADKEQKRQAVNQWIRSSGAFDGVIDFDAATRDPNRPAHILAAFDSGDHLHPQDDGYKAMADSIDLKMLTAQP
jgi:hypothetical protein